MFVKARKILDYQWQLRKLIDEESLTSCCYSKQGEAGWSVVARRERGGEGVSGGGS